MKGKMAKVAVLFVVVVSALLVAPLALVFAADTVTGVTITAPAEGAHIGGTYTITWTITGPEDGDETYNVAYWDSVASNWLVIQTGLPSGTRSVAWNTTAGVQRADYKVRVEVWENGVKTRTGIAGNTTPITIDNTKPTITSATLNYGTGVLAITASEALDVTPATNVDKTKIHINNVTGTNVVTLGADDTVTTAADGATVSITLSEAHRVAALAFSGVAGGDGGAVGRWSWTWMPTP